MTRPTRRTAIVRAVSSSLARCELTFVDRVAIDLDRARAQHAAYVKALEGAGFDVVVVDAVEEFADGCFVEDTAVIFDDTALITRPGAASRRGEVDTIAPVLAQHRRLVRMQAPATLEGGDVLQVGDRVFVGRSTRTNNAGIAALTAVAEAAGKRVTVVEVKGALHLKTAVTAVTDTLLVMNRAAVSADEFAGFAIIDVEDAAAANVVRANDVVFVSSNAARAALEAAGVSVVAVDISEFAKAEAGLSCLSLLL